MSDENLQPPKTMGWSDGADLSPRSGEPAASGSSQLISMFSTLLSAFREKPAQAPAASPDASATGKAPAAAPRAAARWRARAEQQTGPPSRSGPAVARQKREQAQSRQTATSPAGSLPSRSAAAVARHKQEQAQARSPAASPTSPPAEPKKDFAKSSPPTGNTSTDRPAAPSPTASTTVKPAESREDRQPPASPTAAAQASSTGPAGSVTGAAKGTGPAAAPTKLTITGQLKIIGGEGSNIAQNGSVNALGELA